MATIGQRIKRIRLLRKMTQRDLGLSLGFTDRTSDIRIAQYENNSRKPKADLTQSMADVFGVVPEALTVPDIDTYKGLIHTLFALEDIYGLTIDKIDDVVCLHMDKSVTKPGSDLWTWLDDWYAMKDKYIHGRITKEEYDHWRYNFPNDGTSVITVNVPNE